ncbi:MAG: FecR family protein [Treponema sp.]|nr:FecR family protein [Treponema sp.]
MKLICKKSILFSVFFLLCIFAMNAGPAEVTYIRGKVEVCRNDVWVPLKIGDKIYERETISTGFQSEAKIRYNDSIMALGALTRITLDTLSEKQDKDNVALYLNTGAVRSKVNHTENKRISYTVKSPVAVASVRGTEFLITSGGQVSCSDGAVAVYANKEPKRAASDKSSKPEEESDSKEESSSSQQASSASSSSSKNTSADATTPASEIYEDSPVGSVVVAKGQQVSIQANGLPEQPHESDQKQKSKYVNNVATPAETENVVIGSSSNATPQAPVKTAEPAVSPVVDAAKTELNITVTLSE